MSELKKELNRLTNIAQVKKSERLKDAVAGIVYKAFEGYSLRSSANQGKNTHPIFQLIEGEADWELQWNYARELSGKLAKESGLECFQTELVNTPFGPGRVIYVGW